MKNDALLLYRTNSFAYFFSICVLLSLINYFINHYYLTEELFFNTYSEQLSFDRISALFKNVKSHSFAYYIMTPLFFLVQISYNTLFIGAFSYLILNRIEMKKIFNVCLKAEIVFLVMLLAKVLFLQFFVNIHTVYDLNFIPLSLLNLFSSAHIPLWLNYPLQTINIWEVLFVLLASFYFSVAYDIPFKKGLTVIGIGYASGLFIWLLVVLFIQLQFS